VNRFLKLVFLVRFETFFQIFDSFGEQFCAGSHFLPKEAILQEITTTTVRMRGEVKKKNLVFPFFALLSAGEIWWKCWWKCWWKGLLITQWNALLLSLLKKNKRTRRTPSLNCSVLYFSLSLFFFFSLFKDFPCNAQLAISDS
jgi:hypothetical protein